MNITLLFTYGISLNEWHNCGLIDREIEIYKQLIEKDYSVDMITYGDRSDFLYKGKVGKINISPVYERIKKSKYNAMNMLKSFFIPFKFKDVFRTTDIIKTNQMNGSWVGLMAKYIYKKKLIVRCGFEWYRDAYLRRRKNLSSLKNSLAYIMEWIVYKLCDEIIISNEESLKFISKNFNIKPEKIHLIRNYINTEKFRPLNKTKKYNRLLYIGRLENVKNIISILKAIKETPYGLDITGDGKEKEALRNFISDNKLDVELLGTFPNNELPEIINEYNVLILASIYENSPKALLEAMSCGIPVIGTDVDGIREIIRHKENGFLCRTDALSINEAIDTVMQDSELRQKMSRIGRQYVIENCSLPRILEKEIKIYKKII